MEKKPQIVVSSILALALTLLIHGNSSSSRINRFCQTIYKIALALTKKLIFRKNQS
jgi:hypothetical protein